MKKKITSKRPNKKPAGYWDKLEHCIEACKDAGSVQILHKKYRGAGDSIRKHNWQDICYKYLEKYRVREYSKDQIWEIAKRYTIYKEFRENKSGVYSAASNLGILEEITAHMKGKRTVKKYDTPVNLYIAQKEALNYNYRGDFEKNASRIYNWARRHKVLDNICSHMKRKGNKKLRCIYVAEFPNNHAYVGLTNNYERRVKEELTEEDETVYKYIKFSGHKPIYKILNDYIDAEEASKLEGIFWKQYKDAGWTMLNLAKTGSLGGIGYSKDEVIREAAKYESLKQFRLSAPGYYQSGYRSNYWDEVRAICKPLHPKKMEKDEIKHLISLFDKESDLRKYKHSVIDAARRIGIWEECTQYYKQKTQTHKRYKRFTYNEVLSLAKQYQYRTDFQHKNSKAYSWAIRHHIINEVCAHMQKKKPIAYKWSVETVKSKALEYSTIKDFRIGASGAYNAAKRLGILQDVTLNMKREKSYKYSLPEAVNMSKRFSSRSELFRNNRSLYNQLHDASMLDELFPKIKLNVPKKWTIEKRIDAASQCKTRTEFKKKYPQAHEVTRVNKDWNIVAPHLAEGRKLWSEEIIADRCSHCHNMQELKEFDYECWRHVTKHSGKSSIAKKYFKKKE